jgi:hypothetical protein
MIAGGRHRAGSRARTNSVNAFRGRRPVLVGGIVAVGAAAAVAAVVALPGGKAAPTHAAAPAASPTRTAAASGPASGPSASAPSARAVLLASATVAARSPAAGFGPRRPATSDYSMTPHWGVDNYQFSLAGIRALPSTAKALSETLRNMRAHEPDKEDAVGLPDPTYTEYVAAWADALLTAPSRPGTRAAIYRLVEPARSPALNRWRSRSAA